MIKFYKNNPLLVSEEKWKSLFICLYCFEDEKIGVKDQLFFNYVNFPKKQFSIVM